MECRVVTGASTVSLPLLVAIFWDPCWLPILHILGHGRLYKSCQSRPCFCHKALMQRKSQVT